MKNEKTSSIISQLCWKNRRRYNLVVCCLSFVLWVRLQQATSYSYPAHPAALSCKLCSVLSATILCCLFFTVTLYIKLQRWENDKTRDSNIYNYIEKIDSQTFYKSIILWQESRESKYGMDTIVKYYGDERTKAAHKSGAHGALVDAENLCSVNRRTAWQIGWCFRALRVKWWSTGQPGVSPFPPSVSLLARSVISVYQLSDIRHKSIKK